MKLSANAAKYLDLGVSVGIGLALAWAATGNFFPYPLNIAVGLAGLAFVITGLTDSSWLFKLLGVHVEGSKEGRLNIGEMDRAVRIVFGLLMLGGIAAGIFQEGAAWLAVIVAIILLLTGTVGLCPIYRLFGMNTCKR